MEITILHFFESIHSTVLDSLMYYITFLAEKGILWIIVALLFLFVLPKRYRKIGLSVGIALVLSIIICNLILKNLVARDRPFWADPALVDANLESRFHIFSGIDDFSFPSGHTSGSFAAAAAIRLWKKMEGNIAIILAVLIGISRMYLCVHYPTDVLAGAAVGIGCGIVGYYLGKWAIDRFQILREIFKGGKSWLFFLKKQ